MEEKNLEELLQKEQRKVAVLTKALNRALGHGYPFICGHSLEETTDGLPETLMICPCYGVDHSRLYRKVPMKEKEDG